MNGLILLVVLAVVCLIIGYAKGQHHQEQLVNRGWIVAGMGFLFLPVATGLEWALRGLLT